MPVVRRTGTELEAAACTPEGRATDERIFQAAADAPIRLGGERHRRAPGPAWSWLPGSFDADGVVHGLRAL